MPEYPKIWFLRHGQTEWNKAYRLQGQFDSPLTVKGVADAHRQAVIMREILKTAPPCFVSPLGRTRQTADIALNGAVYQTDPRLMEIHAGSWQGRFRNEILAEHPDWAGTSPTALEIYESAPEGEGITALHARVVDFLRDLTEPTVIVAHGLLGQVLRAEVCGLSMQGAGRLSNQQGCVYVLEHGQEDVLEMDK